VGTLAGTLRLTELQVASGIYELVNANMAAALGVVSVERGHDPREFMLVVAGGAGPIHAAAIARELEIPKILVPRESSVFCAAGMLISDLKHDYVRTYAREPDAAEMERVYGELEAEALATLASEGVPRERVELIRSVDLRYVGQFNEVEVPRAEDFHERHEALYGYSMPGAPTELINLRLSARGITDKPKLQGSAPGGEDPAGALKGHRDAYFDGGFEHVPVYDGLRLVNGNVVSGPAIIEQPTTTIVLPPDFDVRCDAHDNYLVEPKER
jgi:N-methylhydantoinase A